MNGRVRPAWHSLCDSDTEEEPCGQLPSLAAVPPFPSGQMPVQPLVGTGRHLREGFLTWSQIVVERQQWFATAWRLATMWRLLAVFGTWKCIWKIESLRLARQKALEEHRRTDGVNMREVIDFLDETIARHVRDLGAGLHPGVSSYTRHR